MSIRIFIPRAIPERSQSGPTRSLARCKPKRAAAASLR